MIDKEYEELLEQIEHSKSENLESFPLKSGSGQGSVFPLFLLNILLKARANATDKKRK